ncbi:MAG: hypothetical protein ACOCP8_09200 [archaeon]
MGNVFEKRYKENEILVSCSSATIISMILISFYRFEEIRNTSNSFLFNIIFIMFSIMVGIVVGVLYEKYYK